MSHFEKRLNELINVEVAIIVREQNPLGRDYVPYFDYVNSCAEIIGRKLVINYESYENWKTDIKEIK